MGDVLALAGFAEAVALDGAGQDDRRLSLVLDRGLVGVEDLQRIVAAEAQALQLIVGQMLDHLQQPRIGAEEVLAEIGARFDGVLLILAVDDLAHPLGEQAVVILREQRIPVGAPQHLDDVPAGAAEDRLELLDDLAVAAHRPVEPLQVAVDDPDQVVELSRAASVIAPSDSGSSVSPSPRNAHTFDVDGLLEAAVLRGSG